MKGVIRSVKGKNVYEIDGEPVSRAEFFRRMECAGTGPILNDRSGKCGVTQKYSDALAVHPEQVEEARDDSRKRGVPTDFLPDGRAVITSRYHQKRYLKAYGFKNFDAGYGD